MWIRTELNAVRYNQAEFKKASELIDPRCTIEWSDGIGPFKGEGNYQKGKDLLAMDPRASWFLKTIFCHNKYRGCFFEEVMKDDSKEELPKFIDAWRTWVQMLVDAKRETLTICHVPGKSWDEYAGFLRIGAALANNPAVPTGEVVELY